jgi:hypothetical protein
MAPGRKPVQADSVPFAERRNGFSGAGHATFSTKDTPNMNVAQLHLALTHFPFVGFIASFGVLLYALWRGSSEVRNVALVGIVLSGLIILPVMATGNGSEDVVEGLPGVAHALVGQHRHAADIASTLALAAAAVALLTLILQRWAPAYTKLSLAGVLTLVLAGTVSIGWAAHLGGEIRHPELALAWNATNDNDSGSATSGEGAEGSKATRSFLPSMGALTGSGERGEGSEGGSGESGEVRESGKRQPTVKSAVYTKAPSRERGERSEGGERGESGNR